MSNIASYLDTPSLTLFGHCSKRLYQQVKRERIKQLFSIAREGGLEEVRLACQEGTSPEWRKALLTRTATMDWEEKPKEDGSKGEITQHTDTLLQLAWRMRDKEMFDVIKAALDKLDPEAAKQQIKDFEGEQADCLDQMAEAYAASDADQDNDALAIRGIGGAQARCGQNMAWVMHRMRHKDSGWDRGNVDKPFKRDVKDLREYLSLEAGDGCDTGPLGGSWWALRGAACVGVAVVVRVCGGLWGVLPADHAVVADLRSKCVNETRAVLSQLSIDQSPESSKGGPGQQ